MRTRKEIEKNVNQGITVSDRYASEDYDYFAIILEVLLDIRELLTQNTHDQ